MMEITIKTNPNLSQYDTGGGIREINAVITIDETLSPRLKRQVVIYETLGCLLGFVLEHNQLEDITEVLVDALDQLDTLKEGKND